MKRFLLFLLGLLSVLTLAIVLGKYPDENAEEKREGDKENLD